MNMEWKRFQEPTFIAAGTSCVLLLMLLAFQSQSPSPAEVVDVRPQLEQLQLTIKASESRLAGLEAAFDKLRQAFDEPAESWGSDTNESFELHTKEDAAKLFSDLGESPAASSFAETLSIIDGWIGKPEDADALQQFKASQIAILRQLVKQEVDLLHEQALKSEAGAKSAELYAKVSQILALYPMDSTKPVLDEARSLSAKHAEVGVRIDAIRRQRYNAWAMTRIEETINAINSTASSFMTSDNPITIEATVKQLGEVDPLLLEPVVAQLYNYAVEQAKSNVDSQQQLELGRRMIDPAIIRKGYGDF
jgi:hypothetical protein